MKQAHGLLRMTVIVAVAGWHAWACAQLTNDPTRPPAEFYAPDSAAGAAVGPVLQSVIITPTGRAAIIGGERVTVGGRYGDARVIRITENEVVLRSADGTETLKMYPGVEMKPIKPPAPASKRPARKGRGTGKLPSRKQG